MNSILDDVDVADGIFKSLVWDVLVKSIIARLIIALSISPQGFLALTLSKIVTSLAEKIYPTVIRLVKISSIKFKDEIDQRAYEKAALLLSVVAIEKGINSDEFKKQRDIEHSKQAELVIFNIQYH